MNISFSLLADVPIVYAKKNPPKTTTGKTKQKHKKNKKMSTY